MAYSVNLPVDSSDTLEGVQSWRERDQVHGRVSGQEAGPQEAQVLTSPGLRTGHEDEASFLVTGWAGSSSWLRPPCQTVLLSGGSGFSQPVGSPRGNGEL